MKNTLTKLAAAGALTLAATASAMAGSTTLPGLTIGAATGAPLPPGFYFVDVTTWDSRDTAAGKVTVGANVPVLIWSTPWQVLGGRLQLWASSTVAEIGITKPTNSYNAGLYNPFFAGQLAWDLGNNWGFSYLLGGYVGVTNGIGTPSNSLNQRFALSYTGNGWNLTADLIWGVQADSVSVVNGSHVANPDFLNIDLTATKKFGKWEVGALGFGSTDLNDPLSLNKKQSQFALGGLVGYNFGPVIVQAYLTRDVTQTNYGGYDTRAWGSIVIPLGDPLAAPKPNLMYHK
jgi:hypothetical protein